MCFETSLLSKRIRWLAGLLVVQAAQLPDTRFCTPEHVAVLGGGLASFVKVFNKVCWRGAGALGGVENGIL